ncbi:hypothetical protein JDV02_008891 [Purpureocillium takamizusanense]|uniref:Uncharacterized protein n=1 Tax=Purpureocillium takamizusanense TaxID=2060973 RepID=A0A9Q8QNS8_9HYPO|nr:uncharacterized protein JDV02_008891 [Purpureocillium takamizusanense]UNI23048.1 hypothetical protein JDV02_008891 [Purpureocillium takamizusanense]
MATASGFVPPPLVGVEWQDCRPRHAPQAPPHEGIDPSSAVDTAKRRLQMREYLEYHGLSQGHNEIWRAAEQAACRGYLVEHQLPPDRVTAMMLAYMTDFLVWRVSFSRLPENARPKWPYRNVTQHFGEDRAPSGVYRAHVQAQNNESAGGAAPSQPATAPAAAVPKVEDEDEDEDKGKGKGVLRYLPLLGN